MQLRRRLCHLAPGRSPGPPTVPTPRPGRGRMGWGGTAQPEARSLPLPALPPRPSPSLLGLAGDVACHVTCAHLQAGHPSSGTGHRLWPPGVFEHLGAIVVHPPRKLLGLLFIPKTPGHFGNADPGADPHARAAGRVAGPPPCRPRDARPTLTLQFPLVAGRAPGPPPTRSSGCQPLPRGWARPLWAPQRCLFWVVASARRGFSSVPADPGSCSPRAGPGHSGLRGAGRPSLGTRAPCSGRRGDGAL